MTGKDIRQPRGPGQQYLLVGRISKPHGIRGEVKVVCFSGDPDRFIRYRQFMLTTADDEPLGVYAVARQRVHGNQVVLQLTGVNDRNGSEYITGCSLWIARDELQPLEADEYYWHEMEGVLVVTDTGRQLGRITAVFNNGAQDILVVKGEEEYLIPVDNDIVVGHDREKGILTVSPLPGLLEINE